MSDSQLTFVLMAGLPGTGKSTLAAELARELGWYVINKDERKEMLLKRGWNSDSASEEAYKQSFAEARSVLTEQQVSVILDSAALHSFIFERAKSIVDELGNTRLKIILCVASRDKRNERIRNRPFPVSSITVNPTTEADYLQYFKHLPSDTKTINTDNPVAEYLAMARDYVTG